MIRYLLSGGIYMVPIVVSFFLIIIISVKNFKGAYHVNKIMLIGSFAGLFGIVATGIALNNAVSILPDISKISPQILWSGIKVSFVTTFSGGVTLFFSTVLWYVFSIRNRS